MVNQTSLQLSLRTYRESFERGSQVVHKVTENRRRGLKKGSLLVHGGHTITRVGHLSFSILEVGEILENELALPVSLDEFVLKANPAAQPVEVLCKPVEAVDRVLVRLAGAAPELCLFADFPGAAEEPLGLGLDEALLQGSERGLMAGNGALKLLSTECLWLLKEEGLCEHAEEGGEGIEGLCHIVLEVLRRALRPHG